MKEKDNKRLIEIYESKKARKAMYSQCNASQCWKPEYNLAFQASPCHC
ncbi:MAG: hypothetical protein ACW98A_13715 [Candidatus Hodarchaeales archaeon]|jgi:hypothetical protein